MIRVLLLLATMSCLLLGLLTLVKSPDWLPWKLAVLAGEYGHWLALLPAGLIALGWIYRGGSVVWATAISATGVLAVGCLLRPAFGAASVGRELRAQLTRAFGEVKLEHAPFAVGQLFQSGGTNVPVQSHAFGAGQQLDHYRAQRTDRRNAPCVIVVHGGGWDSGERTQLAAFNHWLARRGYAVAAVSYRVAPAFPWPAQREDLLAAIAWVKSHALELGVDPTRLVLLGRSAGGQIAQVVGYTAGEPGLRGVIGLYAPSDLNFGYAHAREDDVLKSPALMRKYLGGTPETARVNYDSASALLHVTRTSPPTLLVHGELDTLVWHRHSVRLQARLAELGVAHAFVSLPWATHAFEFNLHGPGGQLTTYAIEWFLAAVTK